jgi:P pilus assembly protein, chaperone PapD
MMSALLRTAALLSLACAILPAHAASFEVAVSPSRFEVAGKAPSRIGQSLTIFNVGNAPTEVALRTLDWTYSPEGNVTYHDELIPGSCRPWVTLERRTVRVPQQGKLAFRFQIDIPPNAPRGECRFMLAVEGVEPAYQAQLQSGGASLSLPVSGRIAVAVYVMIGGAEPKLEVQQLGVKALHGKPTPVVTVTNRGDAHGRLEGGLESVDAKGLKFDLVPEGTPIMPGQTRTLPLLPRADANQKVPQYTLPVKSQGQLDWELGSFKVNAEFK